MLHKKFIIRELASAPRQSAVFILCVILSLMALTTLNGFSESIRHFLLKDARALQGGDIILRSHFPFSATLLAKVREMEEQGKAQNTPVYEFYSMVRSLHSADDGRGEQSLLADLKIVHPEYPFYGKVELLSGRPLSAVLQKGNVIAEQNLLDRMGLQVGDALHVGKAVLTIADVLRKEPDRPVTFLSFGPRLFVAAADTEALDLMKKGSRVRYYILLKIPEKENPDQIVSQLEKAALADQERVESYRDARSRIKRFFDNFFFFLALISIFTLLLAGIGIRTTVDAIFREKERSIATLKALGADTSFILSNYLVFIGIMGMIGSLAGLGAGIALQYVLRRFFGNLLPPDMHILISWQMIAESLLTGILSTGIFSFLPLFRLRNVHPAAVFRMEAVQSSRGSLYRISLALIFLYFVSMVFLHMEEIKTGIWFISGMGVLILLTALASRAILYILRRIPCPSLLLRQAVKGLFRPGNATSSVIITLSASLSLIFTIFLLEENLDAVFVRSYPPDAPNLFFIDIQPDQAQEVAEMLRGEIAGKPPEFYPIIRARLVSVGGEKIDRRKENRRRRDNLSRAFNLTYRDHLLEDEVMRKGKSIFRDDMEGLQVSVLDTVVEMRKMDIGDEIVFKIQGIPVKATVSSIRGRRGKSVKPFFYFVFPENSLLKDAPQSIFTAVRVPEEQMAECQRRIVSRYPNISVIDVSATLSAFSGIMQRLSKIIRFFTLFSIAAGILIIISSILATRYARIREAVYYKILGAGRGFILKIFTLENLLTGSISAFLALLVSQTAAWLICSRYFDIDYRSYITESMWMTGITVILPLCITYPFTLSILKQKPVSFLREQAVE